MEQPKKPQYHHCIPRFILRQFPYKEYTAEVQQDSEHNGSPSVMWIVGHRGRRSSKKHLLTSRPKISNRDSIHFYDISKGELTQQNLGKVYGQTDLYLDPKHQTNVYHLEEKLAFLEKSASEVIRLVHEATSSKFTITRAELGTLRKFIFLMHYRNDALASTFFEETNPHNAPLIDWLRQCKEKNHFSTSTDVWLDGLRYYLETPHHRIVETAEGVKAKRGQEKINEMFRHRVDPELDEFYALEYEGLANYFFLGVWTAAPGTEFILGGNGFGLWEGVIYNTPGAHRLYVVSPRIVIVLRRTILWRPHANDPSVLHSCLAGVEISEPELRFADPNIRQQAMEAATEPLGKKLIDQYRTTAIAQGDRFTFGITQLTREETYAVNEVALLNSNIQDSGSITFSSPICMLDTLRAYMSSKNTFLGGKKSLFNPLYETLSSMVSSASLGDVQPMALPTSPLELADSDADRQFHVFLRYMVLQGITFPSEYNRSYLVYQMATTGPTMENAFSISIRAMVEEAIAKLTSAECSALPTASWSDSASKSPQTLVEVLTVQESSRFFSIMTALMDPLNVGRRSHDPLSTVAYEAAMVGVGQWVVSEGSGYILQGLGPFTRSI